MAYALGSWHLEVFRQLANKKEHAYFQMSFWKEKLKSHNFMLAFGPPVLVIGFLGRQASHVDGWRWVNLPIDGRLEEGFVSMVDDIKIV